MVNVHLIKELLREAVKAEIGLAIAEYDGRRPVKHERLIADELWKELQERLIDEPSK